MSHKFDGAVSDLHLTHSFTDEELKQMNKGFAVALWLCPNCGTMFDSQMKPLDDENKDSEWCEVSSTPES